MNEQNNRQNETQTEEKGFRRAGKILLSKLPAILAVFLLTAVLLVVYEIGIRLRFAPLFWIYFAALAGAWVGYVAYNRGFSRTRVSRNSLPRTWSEEQKDEFYADAARRKKKSKPLFYLAISLALVFAYDIVALYFGDFLEFNIPFLEMFR